MEPIILTEYGETLESYPGLKNGDEGNLSTSIHSVCGGWVDVEPVSETHRVILCRRCRLRVVIPNEVTTFGELRAFFKEFQPEPQEV